MHISTMWLGAVLSGLGGPLSGQAAGVATGPRPLAVRQSDSAAAAPRSISPLQRVISLKLRDVPLRDVLKEIDRRAQLGLAYSPQVVPLDRLVTLEATKITAGEALERVLKGTGARVKETAGTVFLEKGDGETSSSGRSSGTIVGRVTDAKTGVAVAAAEVFLEQTRWRTSTDTGGRYRLVEVDTGSYKLVVRRLGYAKQSRPVTVREDATDTVNMTLEPVATRLNELVTTATGRRRRLELGNDITVLNADSIVRAEPIRSVTDLLEARVPGLVVQRTSGAPGDPARLRLRGVSSPLRNNDPIVVVDGVRMYAEQSAARSGNLAGRDSTTPSGQALYNYATPSPLDYIDPNSIETIEVIKGPSAATLYGQDAANGVIVITTKKGKAGPARWTASAERGGSHTAGRYPDLLVRWGHQLSTNAPAFCPIRLPFNPNPNLRPPDCQGDSLVTFQLLNDPALTVLGKGDRTAATLSVSGGSAALTYAVTGSYQEDLGLPQLPTYEVDRYQARLGAPPLDWMLRPQHLTQWGATSQLTARLGATADLSLTTNFSRTTQQRSSLERQLGDLMSTYLDRSSGTYYRLTGSFSNLALNPVSDILTAYYERATATAAALTNGVNLGWRVRPWLTLTTDAGLNLIQRADEILLPRGAATDGDSIGRVSNGQGTSVMSTVNVRANATAPLKHGFQFQFAAGINYAGTSINDLAGSSSDLPPGTSQRGAKITGLGPQAVNDATFGWYVEPSLGNPRFWFSSGLRLDGGSSYGGGVSGLSLPKFPKLSVSYLVSDEPWFPFKELIQSFRVRVAYGKASRQPGVTDRVRLYSATQQVLADGQFGPGVFLDHLGNTEVRPERSTEIEGGFDVDLLDNRLSVTMTGYRKTTDDALLNVPLAPSVYGDGASIVRNIGVIRNTGLEFTVSAQLMRSGPVTWGTQLAVSQNRNIVVKLGPGVESFYVGTGSRVAPGYPLFGRWSMPVLGYADANSNGALEQEEILLGDTAVYVGQELPNYTANLHTTVSLWRGAVAVNAGFLYENGLSQKNEVASRLAPFSRGRNDPAASLAEQLATADLYQGGGEFSDYNWIQTVSTVRFNDLAVTYTIPEALARRLGAQRLSVSVQGTNLGLWTNYRGLDPNVNAVSTGNGVTDTGVLPQPRTWQVRLSASY